MREGSVCVCVHLDELQWVGASAREMEDHLSRHTLKPEKNRDFIKKETARKTIEA
jgi:hypothetical protein